MNSTALALRTAAVVSFLAVAACDKPKPRDDAAAPAAPAPGAAAPAVAGPPPAAQMPGPLPAAPGWAGEYMGKVFTNVFPAEQGKCIGNTDSVLERYGNQGVRIVGWGWDPAKKAPVSRVILVDKGAVIVGAGESGMPRPDVPAANADIPHPNTGWSVYTPLATGPIDAYGLVGDGKTLCPLGHLEF